MIMSGLWPCPVGRSTENFRYRCNRRYSVISHICEMNYIGNYNRLYLGKEMVYFVKEVAERFASSTHRSRLLLRHSLAWVTVCWICRHCHQCQKGLSKVLGNLAPNTKLVNPCVLWMIVTGLLRWLSLRLARRRSTGWLVSRTTPRLLDVFWFYGLLRTRTGNSYSDLSLGHGLGHKNRILKWFFPL